MSRQTNKFPTPSKYSFEYFDSPSAEESHLLFNARGSPVVTASGLPRAPTSSCLPMERPNLRTRLADEEDMVLVYSVMTLTDAIVLSQQAESLHVANHLRAIYRERAREKSI